MILGVISKMTDSQRIQTFLRVLFLFSLIHGIFPTVVVYIMLFVLTLKYKELER